MLTDLEEKMRSALAWILALPDDYTTRALEEAEDEHIDSASSKDIMDSALLAIETLRECDRVDQERERRAAQCGG